MFRVYVDLQETKQGDLIIFIITVNEKYESQT